MTDEELTSYRFDGIEYVSVRVAERLKRERDEARAECEDKADEIIELAEGTTRADDRCHDAEHERDALRADLAEAVAALREGLEFSGGAWQEQAARIVAKHSK